MTTPGDLPRNDYPTPASREFWDFLSGGSGPCVHCERCGRIVYTTQGLLQSEIEDLRENPDAFEDDINDGVFHTYFLGYHCVYGCPCNTAGQVEANLLRYEEELADWLKMRRKSLLAKVERLKVEGE
jgi:hypothetical protein